MSIRPIDFAMMAPKSQEVSSMTQSANQKSIQENAQIHTQFNQHLTNEHQKTNKLEKSENNEYRYDAREKGNSEYKGNSKKKKDDKKDKDKKDKEIKISSFDMKI